MMWLKKIMLVENGADVNYKNSGGMSPLMLAGELACYPIFKYLVEKGGRLMILIILENLF